MMPLRSLLLCTCLLSATPALAARTVALDHPLSVRLEVHQPTAVVLPEAIASISLGIEKERFSPEYDGPYLYLLALAADVAGRCFVVGQSGALYLVRFTVASPADDIVYLTQAPAPGATSPGVALTPAILLRALRHGMSLPGQTPATLPAPTLTDTRLTLTSSTTVAWGNTVGLLATVQNTTGAPLTLDLRYGLAPASATAGHTSVAAWTFPPRHTVKAVAADEEVLGAGGSTRVYVLLERRP